MKNLEVYLNDHLAGSVGALEMLDDVIDAHRGKPLEEFLRILRTDIEADQTQLRELMRQLEIDESAARKAGAWLMEKFSRAKLHLRDSGRPNLALLQSLESLSLGIAGKQSLWRSLGQLSEDPRLRAFDFLRLEKRAVEQVERVEQKVHEIARALFAPELSETPNE